MVRRKKGRISRLKKIDRDDFVNYALYKGYNYDDVMDFSTDHFENQRSLSWNMKKLKEFV